VPFRSRFHDIVTYEIALDIAVGDAARLLPPFGGQGMNCGLRDAHNLAWKLALVLHGQALPSILECHLCTG
jgi:hypothetical protein